MFVYRTSDNIETVVSAGYFNQKEFGFVSIGTSDHIVNVFASDGFYTVKYDFIAEFSEIVWQGNELNKKVDPRFKPYAPGTPAAVTPSPASVSVIASGVTIAYNDYTRFDLQGSIDSYWVLDSGLYRSLAPPFIDDGGGAYDGNPVAPALYFM